MISIYLIFGVFMLISWLISSRLKSKFEEYSQIPLRSGLSGKEIAEKMLHDNNIFDVNVISVEGQLTDHYNPVDKTVNLSPDVFTGRSVTSAAIAAHECGHAVQHAQAYAFLQMRSSLVPIVSISSQYMQWILLAGVLTLQWFPQLLLVGIAMFALTTVFSIITLPVEFDASARALVWLNGSGITSGIEHDKAANGLKWAAATYVVAALGSLATLAYYIMIYAGGRRS